MTSEMGTEKTAKMTSKEKVLSVYPDARWHQPMNANAGAIFRNGNEKYGAKHLSGWLATEAEAWDDAASRLTITAEAKYISPEYASKLPSAPSPAEETASETCRHGNTRGICCDDALPESVSPEGSAGCMARGHVWGNYNAAYKVACLVCGTPQPAPEVAAAVEDEIDALINEVAPPPLVVPETAVHQLRPLLLELIARRKAAEELMRKFMTATMAQARAEDQNNILWGRIREQDESIKRLSAAPIAPEEVTHDHTWTQREADFFAERNAAWTNLTAAEELIQELENALKGVIPYMEQAETAGLVGHEGCHWPVEFVRAALTRAEEYRKGAKNG